MCEIAFLWGSDRFIGKAIVSYFIQEINFGENSDARPLGYAHLFDWWAVPTLRELKPSQTIAEPSAA
jgi:hypothetical protein